MASSDDHPAAWRLEQQAKVTAAVITVLLLPLVYMIVYATIWVDGFATPDMRAFVAGGIISGLLGSIVGFWLGTSYGSMLKTLRQREAPSDAGR